MRSTLLVSLGLVVMGCSGADGLPGESWEGFVDGSGGSAVPVEAESTGGASVETATGGASTGGAPAASTGGAQDRPMSGGASTGGVVEVATGGAAQGGSGGAVASGGAPSGGTESAGGSTGGLGSGGADGSGGDDGAGGAQSTVPTLSLESLVEAFGPSDNFSFSIASDGDGFCVRPHSVCVSDVPLFDPPLVEWASHCSDQAIVRVPAGMCAMFSGKYVHSVDWPDDGEWPEEGEAPECAAESAALCPTETKTGTVTRDDEMWTSYVNRCDVDDVFKVAFFAGACPL